MYVRMNAGLEGEPPVPIIPDGSFLPSQEGLKYSCQISSIGLDRFCLYVCNKVQRQGLWYFCQCKKQAGMLHLHKNAFGHWRVLLFSYIFAAS